MNFFSYKNFAGDTCYVNLELASAIIVTPNEALIYTDPAAPYHVVTGNDLRRLLDKLSQIVTS